MNIQDIYADLAAFADDEHEVMIEDDGGFLLVRGGKDIAGRLLDTGTDLYVEIDSTRVPYRHFLTRTLGQLDVLADRILQRKDSVPHFVEGAAILNRPASTPEGVDSALSALQGECSSGSPFATRIVFITADAGLGKTALLQELQARQARSFLEKKSGYVFWHLDLQGRQLLRLSEALMGDLGDLRMFGLWMPGLIRLMKHRALVLAIDGFDELSAEQGSNTSLGALASVTAELDGQGTIVAAARRTFFDTEDYLRRAGMVKRSTTSPCEFVEMSMSHWRPAQSIAFLDQYALDHGQHLAPGSTYHEILTALGNAEDHPFLTRPFLLSRAARGIIELNIPVTDFIWPGEDQLDSIAAMVNAFIQREVAEKWKNRVTGEPYLTATQHRELLADIAEEMYQNATDRLPVEVIDTITSILLDSWKINPEYRQQVIEMVHMHVLLVHPQGRADGSRAFDHPEFRDYFIAVALASRLRAAMLGDDWTRLSRFLSVAQLSDSTARYVFGLLQPTPQQRSQLLRSLEEIVTQEFRPTYVQVNVGTLLPFALTDQTWETPLEFRARAISSSIAWENTRLSDVMLQNVTFVNASIRGAKWERVILQNCNLGDLALDTQTQLIDVLLKGIVINSVSVDDGEESVREFAPARIRAVLRERGAKFDDDNEPTLPLELTVDSPLVRVGRLLMNMFRRSTVVRETQARQRLKGEGDATFSQVLEIAMKHGVLTEKTWKGSKVDRIWAISARLDDVMAAEEESDNAALAAFWTELRTTN